MGMQIFNNVYYALHTGILHRAKCLDSELGCKLSPKLQSFLLICSCLDKIYIFG